MKYLIFTAIFLSSLTSFASPSRVEMMKVILNDGEVNKVIADQEGKGFVFDGLNWSNSIVIGQSHFVLVFKKFELSLTADQKNFLNTTTTCGFLVDISEIQIRSVKEKECTQEQSTFTEEDITGESEVPLLETPSIDDFDPKKFHLQGKDRFFPSEERNQNAQRELEQILKELNQN